MDVAADIKIDTKLDSDELWYKDAIIYQLHVKAFADSNNDGIGDFVGLTEKLDYLHDLGVTALWLLPFYPSPGRDDGYDISDYEHINPDFGTLQHFRRFLQEAKRRSIRVITELVINHTSDNTPGSKERAVAAHSPMRAIGTCGATPISATQAPASFSATPRNPTGRGMRRLADTTGTAFSHTSRISISTTRA